MPTKPCDYRKKRLKKLMCLRKLRKKTLHAQCPTLSVCIPTSIIKNSQSPILRTHLVSLIARSCAIYKVDEIIILDDLHTDEYLSFFVNNLNYIETPQYLRKALFPVLPDFKYTGLMSPLEAPHHLRIDQWCKYREGAVIKRPCKDGEGSWVNIGLHQDCKINVRLKENTRVTVKVDQDDFIKGGTYSGTVVSSQEPKQNGIYWGFKLRVIKSLSQAFTNSVFKEPYDLKIGTSDKGTDVLKASISSNYKHALIIFGGLAGIEALLEEDESSNMTIDKMFDHYINTCVDQGARTIRTEEAILISLAVLSPFL
jgi:methyltransferase